MRSAVRWVEVAGYIASSLVFLTFYMRRMVPLRLVALCSNVAFLTYAFALHLAPIAILHGALIPVNIVRLIGALRDGADNPHRGNHLRRNVDNTLSVAPPEDRVMPKTLRDAGLACTDAPAAGPLTVEEGVKFERLGVETPQGGRYQGKSADLSQT